MQRYKLLLEKTPSKVEVSEEVDDVGPKHWKHSSPHTRVTTPVTSIENPILGKFSLEYSFTQFYTLDVMWSVEQVYKRYMQSAWGMEWVPWVGFFKDAAALDPCVHQVDALAEISLGQLSPQGNLWKGQKLTLNVISNKWKYIQRTPI